MKENKKCKDRFLNSDLNLDFGFDSDLLGWSKNNVVTLTVDPIYGVCL